MNKFILENIIRENVKNLRPYSSARDEFTDFHREMIFIDANENPYGTGLNRYPDPHQTVLKRRIAELNNVRPNTILLGNGSDEVLDLLFRAFCEPNRDNVITLPPTYGMYGVLADINAVENRKVLLKADFQPDLGQIMERIDSRTKLIFICSPNNPTGNTIQVAAIKNLLENFNGLVIIDEAYIHFTDQESWLLELKSYPNLIVIQTFSKAFGMAGARLGICYASEEIIAVLKKIKPPYNVNALTQQTVLNQLKDIGKINDIIHTLTEERERLIKALNEINFIEHIYLTEANFILAKVDDADKRYGEIIEKGIVVRNRSSQPLCENCLRFTVGTKEENDILIAVLEKL